ncbi:MAG: hypothetical protein ACYC9L_15945 [Sulfuricaulis sp.]
MPLKAAMEVFKTSMPLGGQVVLADTISYESAWWFVRTWLVDEHAQTRTPERIIRLTGLSDFQEVNAPYFRFLLTAPIPTNVLDGGSETGYVVAIYRGPDRTPEQLANHFD